MNEFLWITLGLFGCIGFVQCIGWLITVRKRPKGIRPGYYLIPLHDEPTRLEAQLRYEVTRLGWSLPAGHILLLVDMGVSEESAAVCDRFVRENPGLFYCTANSLTATIHNLDLLYSE